MTREVVFVGAARTAIGSYGGSLKDIPPADLGALVIKTALERAGVQPKDVGHVVLGHVIPTIPQDAYISRVSALNAGVPQEAPAFNVNRLCGSGLQAIVSAAQAILLGDCDVAVGAGAESMSRGAYLVTSNRWGARMGDVKMLDFMLGALHDPRMHIHMGITAENVAARYDISRDQQDAYAVQSQERAAKAIAAGVFKEQIVPVELKTRKGVVLFDTDEGVKGDTSVDTLSKMKPAFKKEEGTVTAGNASTLNDGAGAVVMASAEKAKALGLKPLARLVSYAHAGVEPEYMGIGPVPASKLALEKAGLKVSDLDLIEANEAFAAQACAVSKEMGFPNDKTNPNGSGISLGHPVGATGAILVTKAIYELQRTGGRYALITMCIGGGQGIAMIIERV
ncbi:acetyl-CoA C-acyltransferase family protein [Aquabacterium parvum]|jgi:acetyl-CoA C-acetyltransferase|uniref:acetyl-CoA C-acyltransferase family protein n=1 Tax=Aquabacterium parvum TaxID=70584 RepID=UPI000718ACC3|nr:acetyl-CoA C-acyltransferase family protein [Aquabacterium parvum]MBU0914740.1 acetyl-CoA C-acyltransferase family protein [Gammaproteobacteria bacterium]